MKQLIYNVLTRTGFGKFIYTCVKSFKIKLSRVRKKQKSIHESVEKVYELGVPHHQLFFGYYDYIPFHMDKSFVLTGKIPAGKKIDPLTDNMEIGYFDLQDENNFKKIGETNAWCWQQSCRLRWLDAENVIYNDIENDQYIAVIKNINSDKIQKVSEPIYELHPELKYGLTINFSRLERLRPGYGYGRLEDETIHQKIPSDDGIWKVEIENSNKELLISYQQVLEIEGDFSTEDEHYFNHMMFSPDGKGFVFLHLWNKKDSSTRASRLLYYAIEEQTITVLEDKSVISHFSWRNNNQLIATAFNRKEGFQYRLYSIKNGYDVLSKNTLKIDGHPTFRNDKKWFVSDTYPDAAGDQNLFIFNIENDKKIDLMDLYSPLKYRGVKRCDLHPRWSSNGQYISVDTTKKGVRTQLIIKLSPIGNE